MRGDDYIFLQMECAQPKTCKDHAWDQFRLLTVDEFTEDQGAKQTLLEHREMVAPIRIMGAYLMHVAGTPASRADVAAEAWTGRHGSYQEASGDGWSLNQLVPIILPAGPSPASINLPADLADEEDDGWGGSKRLRPSKIPDDDGWGDSSTRPYKIRDKSGWLVKPMRAVIPVKPSRGVKPN